MARLTLAVLALVLLAPALPGQDATDLQFKQAGVCARCHVISVVEWGMSAHRKAGIDCVACHGESRGHVADERNNVKPDRLPRDAAIPKSCLECHAKNAKGEARRAVTCQNCHHVHALVNPNKPAMAEAAPARQAAAPAQPPAARPRRELPGFEIAGDGFDARTGLPLHVRVAGLGIPMVLVPGGEFDMGTERFESAKPIHTVRVKPFYLARSELTQAEWKALMGSNPGAPAAGGEPVGQLSWNDCQAFTQKLNGRVPGGGFRLPTEAEWEYAARAADRLALQGMRGSLWEWCSSVLRPYPYLASDGREDPGAPGLRVLRGGGYAELKEWLDPGARHGERPARRLRMNGVRLARSAPE